MKKIVTFEENGSEYTGYLTIECTTLNQIDNRTIEVNGALISIDEDIIYIEDAEGPIY